MGGGLIQLVAYGAQDVYITGNPQITFFKAIYKRHTNFAIENFQQYPIGTIGWGNKLTFNIDRKADLLGSSYLEFYLEFIHNDHSLTLSQLRKEINKGNINNSHSTLSKSLGYSFIDYIDIEIGGTTIDTHTGHWLAIYNELTQQFNKSISDMLLTGGFYKAPHISDTAIMINIPLKFWFNRNPGLYLPLVALQYHDVKLEFLIGGKISSLLIY